MTEETEQSTQALSVAEKDAPAEANGQQKTPVIDLPSLVAGSGTLDRLVETARDYARSAASENTVKAYAKDWAQFARWCRMRGADPLPLRLSSSASTSRTLPCRQERPLPSRFRPSNAGSRAGPGAMRNAGKGWTARTATSPRFWPASAAGTPAHQCRKRRSCPRTCARCWQPCPSTCAVCATGRFC